MSSTHSTFREMKGRARLAERLPIGSEHGRFTVTGHPVFRTAKDGKKKRWWIDVRCRCGNERLVLCQNLLSGASESCGCLKSEQLAKRLTTHGGSRSMIYRLWHAMLTRCYSPGHKKYRYYGGRGIVVCEEWRGDFATFRDWAVANGYRPGLEIDRKENDGPYSPGNCQFVTHAQQQRNRSDSRPMKAFGETKLLIEWKEDARCVVKPDTVAARLRYGWDLERALTTPPLIKR